MEGCVLWQVPDMQILFVDGRCQYLFMEMGVADGDFSSELVANPPPGAKGIPRGRRGCYFYYGYVLAAK